MSNFLRHIIFLCCCSPLVVAADSYNQFELKQVQFDPNVPLSDQEKESVREMFEALFPNTELQSYSSHGAQELINRLSALESCKATINSAMEGVDGLVGVALKTTVLTNIASVLLNAGNSVGQQSCIAHIQKSRNVIVTEMNSSHI